MKISNGEVVQFSREEWRVYWNGRLTSPTFNSKGAALAYATILQSGARNPEYLETAKRPIYSYSQSHGDPSEWRVWRTLPNGKQELVSVCDSRTEAWELVQELSEDSSVAEYRQASKGK